MLNPANLFAPRNQAYLPTTRQSFIKSRASTSIITERPREDKKSKWDQPLVVPPILYQKFKVPMPDQTSKAKIIAQKKLEQLEEKLKKNDAKQEKQEKQEKIMFIGFRNAPIKVEKPTPPPMPIPMEVPKLLKEPKPPKEPKLPKQPKQPKPPKEKSRKVKQVREKPREREKEEKKVQRDDFSGNIVGKSKSIEKPYLRITGTPDPDTIRPQYILKRALKYFLDQYKKGRSYEYLIEQFRSIRQDLTVQNIKNSLTVQVYEENLKLSLFEGDTAQFKHCQTNLWQLYRQGLIYTKQSRNKFIGYQMITLVMQEKFEDVEYMLVEMPQICMQTKEIKQSLQLKRLFLVGNYRGFFNYYDSTKDEVCRCLLNQYVDKVRIKCLLMVCNTFGEKIPIQILANTIGQDEDLLQAMIHKEGGIIEDGNFLLKPSYEKLLKSQHLASKKVSILFN